MDTQREGPTIRILDGDGTVTESPLEVVSVAELTSAQPFSTLSWYSGQTSLPGWYWSSTMGAHVPYTSRLALARLLLADFDSSVATIVAQPFQIVWRNGGRARKHTPEFLFVGADHGVTIVNVRSAEAQLKPKTREVFAMVTDAVGIRGWQHQVWGGGNPTVLANVRFLAGFRRCHYAADLLTAVEGEAPGGAIFNVEDTLAPSWDRRTVRAAILHLIWTSALHADITVPLSSTTVLGE